MRRFLTLAILAFAVAALSASIAWAGNPHFVSVTATREGNSLIVEGKEAGLGNETQVHIEVRATAECINPGKHHPKAENKESVSAEGDFPVQNGKAEFSLTLTASFQPECSPPMTVRFSNVVVEDTEHGVRAKLPGTF
jgi:phage tail sheath gpL-like